MPTTLAPSATALTHTLAGPSGTALDQTVGTWIRGIVSKEPSWDKFVERRRRTLKISEQLEQYKYVQRIFDRYVGTSTPVDLQGAGGVVINRVQVLRAFNLPASWGEECTETLVLTTLYGPGGTRCDDPRVRDMMDAEAPVTTTIHARRFLTLLREIHGQWTIAHPDG
ncbi:hypothetical protein C2E23DRAFT_732894 [Lenzites betulinus]|nr:hypothetical protein C2E23DRAFT_732894 [Lenzites betulinus]